MRKSSTWLQSYVWLESELGLDEPLALKEFVGRKLSEKDMAIAARGCLRLDPKEAVRDVCGLLEDNGVRVLLLDKKTDAFFGLSVSAEGGGPAVVVNTSVFTHAEFVAAHTAGGRSRHTSDGLLANHVAAGRLLRIRRGLYAVVPPGANAVAVSPDPYLVATRLREDAVVAYHAALAFHRTAYSIWSRIPYLTASRVRSFEFRGQEYVGVQAPLAVRALPDFGAGVVVRPYAGGDARVTSLERTLVDLLHSPEHGGGWEEIWRSLETVEFFDLQAIAEYTLRLGSALTAARVGFFLEQHREEWMVEGKHLEPLVRVAPAQPRYLGPDRESGKLIRPWNLVVPEYVLERRWEEPH